MATPRTVGQRFAVITVFLLYAAGGAKVALAQASIAGVVRDASGAVLPGVTVEAASPVLIEKVRTVVDRRRRPVPDRAACGPAPTR